jgi:tRNA threonylcarbamoyladenosine biosynthesis protein TsaB
MALILCLETSAALCSVALYDNDILLNARESHEKQAHASRLAVLIDEVFKNTSYSLQQVQAVAVSSGPGSYTGLRIGTSTAKGICFALQVPLIAVPTAELLTLQAIKTIGENALYCPMIDAKRMEVYCQVFDRNLKVVRELESLVITDTSFRELLDEQRVFFFGDGSEKCKAAISHRNARFIDGLVPMAAMMGAPAYRKLDQGRVEDLTHFTPQYLKEFIAKKAQPVL